MAQVNSVCAVVVGRFRNCRGRGLMMNQQEKESGEAIVPAPRPVAAPPLRRLGAVRHCLNVGSVGPVALELPPLSRYEATPPVCLPAVRCNGSAQKSFWAFRSRSFWLSHRQKFWTVGPQPLTTFCAATVVFVSLHGSRRLKTEGAETNTLCLLVAMDIHRCRFVPFPASPINAVAFSHPLLDSKRPARLAIGRANGDIEIWNPLNGNWFQETIIHGGRDRSVDALVWVTGDDEHMPDGSVLFGRSRLFSIGYTTTVTEWDLEQGRAKKHASGQHGDIWCLGAQPAPSKEQPNGVVPASQPQRLVAGTIDGSIVLYSIDDDDLQFQRVLVKTHKKNIKMVSIAFQSRQIAVVGCSDSAIRVYDLRRGELIRTMTLGKDLLGGSKDIIVWSVKCLKNGDIVSGDSTGQVCIWDGKTYTQAQRIQGHKQDVLSLATSADGSSIISGGMDRRTALYRPMPRDPSRWQRLWHRKYHDHDVKAMASFEGQGMSVVVTGGENLSSPPIRLHSSLTARDQDLTPPPS